MPSILLIYDEELLAKLYSANLSVYLDASLTRLNDFLKLKDVLLKNKIDLILVLLTKEQESKYKYIEQLLLEYEINSSIIVVGDKKSKINLEDSEIKSYFSVQKVIRLAAKKLKITARDMAQKQVSKFYPIEVNLLTVLKKSPVNIYKKIEVDSEDEYLLIASKNDELVKKMENLQIEKVEQIYVNASDRLSIINSISTTLCENLTLTSLIQGSHKAEFVALNMDLIGRNIVSDEIAEEVSILANSCTKIMSDVVEESPSLSNLLEVFQRNKNGYVYIHSMLNAYVASHIVRNVNWGGESHIEKLNYVLFFHDMALAPLYEKNPEFTNEEDLLFLGNLNEAEKNIVINHARMAAEMVAGLRKSPIGADLLIKQHHGMGNGVGFAMEYRDDISPLSKIIIISEAFVDEYLILKKENKEINVNLIIGKLSEKFTKHTYKKIIETLVNVKI